MDTIIDELKAQIPEASVTSIKPRKIRSAKYVSNHIVKRDGTKIFIEINTTDATEEDIKNL